MDVCYCTYLFLLSNLEKCTTLPIILFKMINWMRVFNCAVQGFNKWTEQLRFRAAIARNALQTLMSMVLIKTKQNQTKLN